MLFLAAVLLVALVLTPLAGREGVMTQLLGGLAQPAPVSWQGERSLGRRSCASLFLCPSSSSPARFPSCVHVPACVLGSAPCQITMRSPK